MPQFFIGRPIFAWVVAIFIVLGGLLALPFLPISQYPDVAPPQISINTTYPGATPEEMYQSVTRPIEEELNGVEGLLYFESTSDSSGWIDITATFAPGTDPNDASVEVQNSIRRVEPRLPRIVTQQGVQVQKASSSFLMAVALTSTDGSFDVVGLGDYLSRNVLGELRRINGVGRAQLFATERAMRIWMDPDKMVGLNLTAGDVIAAIEAQNAQVAAGRIGAQPAPETQQISAGVLVKGQLTSPEEFGAIVLRANPDGSTVRLRDVARIEVGAEDYNFSTRLNGQPSAGIGIQLSPKGNALATSKAVREKMEELAQFFPPGLEYSIPYDTSPFIEISIEKVVHTLIEAVVLVFLVMFLFLQNLRYTIIPTLVVPIALMGTCAVMLATGFSINVLTMFAMVLAIGILVDDAIVVVENVERVMAEEGLPPKDATRKAMKQITGAIIGITLVLSAVFVPMAFFPGAVGVIYRQFSLTMVVSILFSAFLALLVGLGWAYMQLPTSFLPNEDQGYLIADMQAPAEASSSRLQEVIRQVEEIFWAEEAVDRTFMISGYSFSGTGQNAGLAFINLKDWSERGSENSAAAIANRVNGAFMGIKDAIVFALSPPPIQGLGSTSGFTFRLQDRAGLGQAALAAARDQLLDAAAQSEVLTALRVEGMPDAARINLVIDREKANTFGVTFADINTTISANFGSTYVNDFPNAGRMQRVTVQADAQRRIQADDLLALNVRNVHGGMVPLSAVASVEWEKGPTQVVGYNGYPSVRISGEAAPGYSSGAAIEEMERLAAQLPEGFGYEWTGQSLQEIQSGSQAPFLIGLSIIFVFLLLAALYESWSIPLSVMLVVPLGVMGAVAAVMLRDMPNDVYFKVGLIAIIGLSAKNAILIIEFAKDLRAQGKSLLEATTEAARLRFRPIIMTSLAFTFGVTPLAVATGASAASQNAIGTGVLGGMISATILAVFFVPVFFVFVMKLLPQREAPEERQKASSGDAQAPAE